MKTMSIFVKRVLFAAAIGLSALLQACGGGGGSSPPPPGTLSVNVTSGSPAAAVSDVSVLVFNATTNAPVASGVSDSTGKYSVSLVAGSYFVKLSKQGYAPVPASALLSPVPKTVNSGQTTTYSVNMTASALSGTGWVSGKVSNGSSALANVLVAVEASGVAYTSISDSSGNYAIYNVPAAAYTVTGYAKGYSFVGQSVTVGAAAGSTVNLSVGPAPAGTVPVNFNLIAQTGVTKPANMLVSLVHPITRETIPGQSLTQPFANALSYSFSGVADGNYLVRATYANDTIVVDPDYIVKFGEPAVTVSSGAPTPNPVQITATGAVQLTSPTNPLSSTAPTTVTGTLTPTFSWSAYSSTSDYVIEVMDADSGTVIWGGFSGMGTQTPAKNIVIPSSQTSIVYNADNSAAPLAVGKTYRWRVYASKNDTSTLGWHLISMSEDQMGLFTVQ